MCSVKQIKRTKRNSRREVKNKADFWGRPEITYVPLIWGRDFVGGLGNFIIALKRVKDHKFINERSSLFLESLIFLINVIRHCRPGLLFSLCLSESSKGGSLTVLDDRCSRRNYLNEKGKLLEESRDEKLFSTLTRPSLN